MSSGLASGSAEVVGRLLGQGSSGLTDFDDDTERRAQERLDAPHLGEEPLALALAAARDRPRLSVRLGDDQLRLALGPLPHLLGGALGRDERVRQQLLALLQLLELLLELLDLVGELAAVAPHGLEAVGDVVQDLFDARPVVAERATSDVGHV